MSLLIILPIAIVFVIIFWRINVSLYRRNYGPGMGIFNESLVHTYNALHAPINYKPLEVSVNFFNFTANLILKTIHFVIFAVVSYIFRNTIIVSIILCGIYGLFTALAWLTYKGRRTFYNEIPEDYVKAFTPILKASICIPLYQTIIAVLLLFA